MAKKKTSRVAGRHIAWSADELLRLSSITPEDIAAAKAIYRRLAPKRIKRLPDEPVKHRG